ncbi:tRNA-modifying protein YgfZ [Calidithermus terrae]|uniref:tRNA-modifying protein YgfZ n=1 Tax=Calidithermus terrae TaxID=1408545 RepID=A0A399F6Q8_9DEIN|nr:folate-binding protein YgfZ [Calidithermus terrae]RIH90311.1 tRNA-modifying protein YgfZ [Calidithermus terrae]
MRSAVAAPSEAELEALRQGAGLVRQAGGLLEVRGADRADFLHNQCTSHVKGLPPGGWLETLFLNNRGQVEFLGEVFHLPERLWLTTDRPAELRQRFLRYIIFDQVEVAELPGYALLELVGPRAAEVLPAPEAGRWAEHEGGVVARHARGLRLVVPAERLEAVRRQVLGAGGAEVSPEAYALWRVEQGLAGGLEALGELPQEVGLEARVSYKKGCYLGQEIMARLEARGNTRYRLVALQGEGLEPGAEVRRGEKAVGRVGTVALSPQGGRLALALLRKEVGAGEEVQVGGSAARVLEPPLRGGKP